jgi:hypothetical protein
VLTPLHSLSHTTDYFNDITTFVEPGFSRRTCEGVLEELVRRSISYAVAAMDGGPAAAAAAMGVSGPDPGVTVLARMAQDERDVQVRGEEGKVGGAEGRTCTGEGRLVQLSRSWGMRGKQDVQVKTSVESLRSHILA